MSGGVGRSADGVLCAAKQLWEGGSHIWLLLWEIHQWHQCPVFWTRFTFLNWFKHAVQSREQGLASIFKEPWPTKLKLKRLSSTTKNLHMQKKKIAWLWRYIFCLFSYKFIFSTKFELDSARLRKKEDKSWLSQKRHSPKEQRFQCCISEPLTDLCWS